MAWQNWKRNQPAPNYSTNVENVSEDSFLSDVMEFGKFNQDFFITKIMSKAIDNLGTDPQKFILLMDMLEMTLSKSNKLDSSYGENIGTELKAFLEEEGEEPELPDRKLDWKLKRASVKFACIFGALASKTPIEVMGELDPIGYKNLVKEREEKKIKKGD